MSVILDPGARAALDGYLAGLDTVVPDAWVYLTGSAALDDWQPERSDLDILVVTSDELGDCDLDALDAMHAAMPGKPYLDAVYVHRDQLGKPRATGVPCAVDGVFSRDREAVNPVLWATLDRYGIPVRGPAVCTLGAGPDLGWLREWNLDNLKSYWRPWAAWARTVLADRDADAPAKAYSIAWAGTGPGRLHYTVATGAIMSKTAAADYTAKLFPEYATLLARAKAWRLGDGTMAFTTPDGLATCDLIDAVIDDAEA
jgi:aminoglycoside adenylyltransferase-like protein/nucleotidyltransferase-like protein